MLASVVFSCLTPTLLRHNYHWFWWNTKILVVSKHTELCIWNEHILQILAFAKGHRQIHGFEKFIYSSSTSTKANCRVRGLDVVVNPDLWSAMCYRSANYKAQLENVGKSSSKES